MSTPMSPNVPRGLSVLGDWLSEVFKLWSAQWPVWVLQGLILFALAVLANLLGKALYPGTPVLTPDGSLGYSPHHTNTVEILSRGLKNPVVLVLRIIVASLLAPGMIKTALKQLHGQTIAISDIFSGVRYFLVMLVTLVLIDLGLLGCIVGAIPIAGLLSLTLPLAIDRNLGLGEALSLSWETTTKNFWLYVFFVVLTSLLAMSGLIACCVGVIATIPFYYIGLAVAYERTFNSPGSQVTFANSTANVPPPPYMPPPAEKSNVQFCPTCGTHLDGSPTICPQCGRQL